MPFKFNATTGLLDLVNKGTLVPSDLTPYWRTDGSSSPATGNWDLGTNALSGVYPLIVNDTYANWDLASALQVNGRMSIHGSYIVGTPGSTFAGDIQVAYAINNVILGNNAIVSGQNEIVSVLGGTNDANPLALLVNADSTGTPTIRLYSNIVGVSEAPLSIGGTPLILNDGTVGTGSGNVLVGTATDDGSGAKLQVNGAESVNSIRVTSYDEVWSTGAGFELFFAPGAYHAISQDFALFQSYDRGNSHYNPMLMYGSSVEIGAIANGLGDYLDGYIGLHSKTVIDESGAFIPDATSALQVNGASILDGSPVIINDTYANYDGLGTLQVNGPITVYGSIPTSFFGNVTVISDAQAGFSFQHTDRTGYIFGHDEGNSGAHNMFFYDHNPSLGDLVPIYIEGDNGRTMSRGSIALAQGAGAVLINTATDDGSGSVLQVNGEIKGSAGLDVGSGQVIANSLSLNNYIYNISTPVLDTSLRLLIASDGSTGVIDFSSSGQVLMGTVLNLNGYQLTIDGSSNLQTTALGAVNLVANSFTVPNIIDSGLTASLGVYTDGSKQLTSTPPTSGVLGYWSRSGTALTTSNVGDSFATTGMGNFGSTSLGTTYLNSIKPQTYYSGSTFWSKVFTVGTDWADNTFVKVNDGNLTAHICQLDGELVGDYIQLDLGVGNGKAFNRVDISKENSLQPTLNVQWSDDGSTFTTVASVDLRTPNAIMTHVLTWTNSTPHRYWRLTVAVRTGGGNYLTEIQFYTDQNDLLSAQTQQGTGIYVPATGGINFNQNGSTKWTVGGDPANASAFTFANSANFFTNPLLLLTTGGFLGVNIPTGSNPRTYVDIAGGQNPATDYGRIASAPLFLHDPAAAGASKYLQQILFGTTYQNPTYASGYFGYVITHEATKGYGDFVWGNRIVETDTQPTEKMRLTSDGKLGIGVASPAPPGKEASPVIAVPLTFPDVVI